MTKELIKIKTNDDGYIPIKAYKIKEGLYIHKSYQGNKEFSKDNYWTLTHKSGYSLKLFYKMRLKDVFLKCEKLFYLDWTKQIDMMSIDERKCYFESIKSLDK